MNETYRPSPVGNANVILIPYDDGPIFDVHRGNMLGLAMKEQFGGKTNEDPNEHLQRFNTLCSSVTNVPPERVKLMPFPFTVKDRASS